MPDKYWDGVRKDIAADQVRREQEIRGIRCARCDNLFDITDRPDGKGKPVICGSCFGVPMVTGPRRGPGSFESHSAGFGSHPAGFGRTPEQINETD